MHVLAVNQQRMLKLIIKTKDFKIKTKTLKFQTVTKTLKIASRDQE